MIMPIYPDNPALTHPILFTRPTNTPCSCFQTSSIHLTGLLIDSITNYSVFCGIIGS